MRVTRGWGGSTAQQNLNVRKPEQEQQRRHNHHHLLSALKEGIENGAVLINLKNCGFLLFRLIRGHLLASRSSHTLTEHR